MGSAVAVPLPGRRGGAANISLGTTRETLPPTQPIRCTVGTGGRRTHRGDNSQIFTQPKRRRHNRILPGASKGTPRRRKMRHGNLRGTGGAKISKFDVGV